MLNNSAPSFAQTTSLKKQKYEQKLIDKALKKYGLRTSNHPHNKTISKIIIERYDIISDIDPYPNILNAVHVKTQAYIIKQELLQRVGERYNENLIRESERNMRSTLSLAVARIVSCQGESEEKITLLVVAKDIWSIRLNIIYNQTGSLIHELDFTPTEMNFLGLNKSLSLHLRFEELELSSWKPSSWTVLDTFKLGARYFDPRLFGSRFRFLQEFDILLNGRVPNGGAIVNYQNHILRGSLYQPSFGAGSLQGIRAHIYIDRPKIPLANKWSYAFSATYGSGESRSILPNDAGPQISTLESPSNFSCPDSSQSCTYFVPHLLNYQSFSSAIGLTRSTGTKLKHDIGVSLGLSFNNIFLSDDLYLPDEVRDWYLRTWVPRDTAETTVMFSYNIRPTQYLRLRNITTFALTEDFSIGPSFSSSASIGRSIYTLGYNFTKLSTSARYTYYVSKHYLSISLGASSRYEWGMHRNGEWFDLYLTSGLRYFSPNIIWGRFHFYTSAQLRENYISPSYIRLTNAFIRGYSLLNDLGRHAFKTSLEYRSQPINLFTLHMGAILFYDGGSVWGSPTPGASGNFDFKYRQSIGIGFRALFPQFDRETFRLDIAFPLDEAEFGFQSTWISLSFGQAF